MLTVVNPYTSPEQKLHHYVPLGSGKEFFFFIGESGTLSGFLTRP
jgi:hypothetical protein